MTPSDLAWHHRDASAAKLVFASEVSSQESLRPTGGDVERIGRPRRRQTERKRAAFRELVAAGSTLAEACESVGLYPGAALAVLDADPWIRQVIAHTFQSQEQAA